MDEFLKTILFFTLVIIAFFISLYTQERVRRSFNYKRRNNDDEDGGQMINEDIPTSPLPTSNNKKDEEKILV